MVFDWRYVASLGVGFVIGIPAAKILEKAIDPIYKEYRHRRDARDAAKRVVDRHSDPVLKAADDLVGKLQSLAGHDFKEFRNVPDPAVGVAANAELTNVLYLFGQLWCRVQILRQEALYVNLTAEPSGDKLKRFLETLERRGVRVVERPYQRAMGESLIRIRGQTFSCISYYEFVGSISRAKGSGPGMVSTPAR
jgi:hypothetical protein